MRITPYADLVAVARERYQARYAKVPEPIPVNVDAVMVFTEPRRFECGGVGYRAPPLPFRAAVQLLVAANALRDLRHSPVPVPAALEATRLVAAHLLRRAVVPAAWPLRLVWRFARRAFTDLSADQLEGLLRWLLDYPDASPLAPPTKPQRLDFMDGLAGFARAFPGWLGPDGMPRSWAHYVYGSRHLARGHARFQVLTAIPHRVAGAVQRDWELWVNEQLANAGWGN